MEKINWQILKLFWFIYFYFMYRDGFPTGMPNIYVQFPQMPVESTRYPGIEATDGC